MKGTVLLAAMLVAGVATTADAAARRKAPAMDAGLQAQEQSNMFIRDAFQPWTTKYETAAKPRARKMRSKRRR